MIPDVDCCILLISGTCAAQMIYFVVVASVLVAQNGAEIQLTGRTPRVIYGQLDSSDALTLTRNISEDRLVCSGEFEAADLRIAGTTTTVADLIGEVATLRQEMAAVKQFVGMTSAPVQVAGYAFNNRTQLLVARDAWCANASEATKKYGPISEWDISAVKSLDYLFCARTSRNFEQRGCNGDCGTFNEAIGAWDTSQVTSVNGIFRNAPSFNQPIGSWNTSSVTNLHTALLKMPEHLTNV